ncbi:hypothetical protein ES288_D09G091500v1 [Gossypium darwinii]|uniref:Uncharacterized protein n=1 Tax=Gossypium darwinii TaxID=34276 RepID=A0A5D2BAT7_GOSDA|nr:hypothetical protein ES288_D09G091500v1 [Gossypium darwinii]
MSGQLKVLIKQFHYIILEKYLFYFWNLETPIKTHYVPAFRGNLFLHFPKATYIYICMYVYLYRKIILR